MLTSLPAPYRSRAAFAALFDHTLLKPEATPEQVRTLCDEARTHALRGVCVNPCYAALAARQLAGSDVLPVVVVGFPLGASRTDVKLDEALRAIGDGARELDMVINVGLYLGGQGAAARHDLSAVVRAAGDIPVKVILETALLSAAAISELSAWAGAAGAAFVKTSTGFAARGASVADIAAMRLGLGAHPEVAIKASGGIRSLAAVVDLVAAGASCIGSSNTLSILEEFAAAAAAPP